MPLNIYRERERERERERKRERERERKKERERERERERGTMSHTPAVAEVCDATSGHNTVARLSCWLWGSS